MKECWTIWSLARNRSRARAICERNGYLTFGVYRMCFLLMAFFTVATNSHLERSPTVLFLLLENDSPHVGASLWALFRNLYIFLFFFAAKTHSGHKFHCTRQVPQKFVLLNLRATCVRIKRKTLSKRTRASALEVSLLCYIAMFSNDLYGIWTKLQVRATSLLEMRDDRRVGDEKRYYLRVIERHE